MGTGNTSETAAATSEWHLVVARRSNFSYDKTALRIYIYSAYLLSHLLSWLLGNAPTYDAIFHLWMHS